MKKNMEKFKVGDRVSRKKENPYQSNIGTIEVIDDYGRCYILWDKKASNGQQHSTLDPKKLVLTP